MSCCHPDKFDQVFDRKLARRELKTLLRKGPRKSTRVLVEQVRKCVSIRGKSLLDIGGGVGAIPFAMINDGLESVTNVDASSAYQTIVHEEAERRDQTNLFTFFQGDFVSLADEIESSDIVTLDRVICCYENMESLVGTSLEKASGTYAVVFPRSVWWNRILFMLTNVSLWIMRKEFRTYVHDSDNVRDLILARGFEARHHSDLLVWQVSVYERTD
ncbi:MAG: methyltransferase domain-containing protein [Rhodothermales bacterium]|nr:methyltransferase domain-containing protein [Rhodothermales bacterium]